MTARVVRMAGSPVSGLEHAKPRGSASLLTTPSEWREARFRDWNLTVEQGKLGTAEVRTAGSPVSGLEHFVVKV